MDDKELVERLRKRIPIADLRVGRSFSAYQMSAETLDEAADALEHQASRITVLREALGRIEALKPKPIGDSGFQTGPALLIDHAKAIARQALSGEESE